MDSEDGGKGGGGGVGEHAAWLKNGEWRERGGQARGMRERERERKEGVEVQSGINKSLKRENGMGRVCVSVCM